MIVWLLALFDLFIGLLLLLMHFDFLPWRYAVMAAIAFAGKAIIFNDKFLSFIDVLVAFYMIMLVFIESTFLTWICIIYIGYKALVSL